MAGGRRAAGLVGGGRAAVGRMGAWLAEADPGRKCPEFLIKLMFLKKVTVSRRRDEAKLTKYRFLQRIRTILNSSPDPADPAETTQEARPKAC